MNLRLRSAPKMLLAIGLSLSLLSRAQTAPASPWKSSIRGKLLDDAGQPLAGWRVVAGIWKYHSGYKELEFSNPAELSTRADGSFLIDNLDPGEYFLRAEDPYLFRRDLSSENLPPQPVPHRLGEAYVTTYFPGVTDIASAATIHLIAGAGAGEIQFRLQSARVFHINGRINPLTASRIGTIRIQPLPSLIPGDRRSISTNDHGTFQIESLLPGTYILDGESYDHGEGWNTVIRRIVTITDHNVAGLVVDAGPCPKVTITITVDGRVISDSAQPPGLSRFHGVSATYGQPDADGSTTVPCAEPGQYFVDFPLQDGVYLKSMRLNGKEVSGTPLDLTESGDKRLDIAYLSNAAAVRGVVRDSSGRPQSAIPVTLWDSDTGFNTTATTTSKGEFEFRNLAPGSYRIAAWDGLYPQPSGWGVPTMREFRGEFEAAATQVTLREAQSLSIEPVLIPAAAIEQAASKLHLAVVMKQTEEVDAIARAIRSPQSLARFLESHREIDWKLLRNALGLPESEYWQEPCMSDTGCTFQIETVAEPSQAILIVRGGEFTYPVECLRYRQPSPGVWQFAGEYSALQRNSSSHYKFVQHGGVPFFLISSDHSQTGFATQQIREDWFDLAQPDFVPVFSFTPDGAESRFGMGVGRDLHATPVFRWTAGREIIELALNVRFRGLGLDEPANYFGIYERLKGEKAFTLRSAYSGARRAPMVTTDFEELADPFGGPSNEKLLSYAFSGLQKIAEGSNADAREWLESVLKFAQDTPEKRQLLLLLKKH